MSADSLPTGGTHINHGCYAVNSKFDIEQHGYAGAENGYIELLEIKDGPEDKPGVVIVWHSTGAGYRLYEFRDVEHVREVWPADRPWPDFNELGSKHKFTEIADGESPWFYEAAAEAE